MLPGHSTPQQHPATAFYAVSLQQLLRLSSLSQQNKYLMSGIASRTGAPLRLLQPETSAVNLVTSFPDLRDASRILVRKQGNGYLNLPQTFDCRIHGHLLCMQKIAG